MAKLFKKFANSHIKTKADRSLHWCWFYPCEIITIEQIAQGYKRLELISDRIEAESYPKRSQVKQSLAETVATVRSDIELLDQTDEAQALINNLVQMIEDKRLQVKVYTKGTLHAKAYIPKPFF